MVGCGWRPACLPSTHPQPAHPLLHLVCAEHPSTHAPLAGGIGSCARHGHCACGGRGRGRAGMSWCCLQAQGLLCMTRSNRQITSTCAGLAPLAQPASPPREPTVTISPPPFSAMPGPNSLVSRMGACSKDGAVNPGSCCERLRGMRHQGLCGLSLQRAAGIQPPARAPFQAANRGSSRRSPRPLQGRQRPATPDYSKPVWSAWRTSVLVANIASHSSGSPAPHTQPGGQGAAARGRPATGGHGSSAAGSAGSAGRHGSTGSTVGPPSCAHL